MTERLADEFLAELAGANAIDGFGRREAASSATVAASQAWSLLGAYADGTMRQRLWEAANGVVPDNFCKINRHDAVGMLATRAGAGAGPLLRAIGYAPRTESEALRLVDGMLYADAAFADYLEGFGSRGKVLAGKIRAKARERAADESLAPGALWVLWIDASRLGGECPIERRTGCRWVTVLLEVLWHDVVLPGIKRAAMAEFLAGLRQCDTALDAAEMWRQENEDYHRNSDFPEYQSLCDLRRSMARIRLMELQRAENDQAKKPGKSSGRVSRNGKSPMLVPLKKGEIP